MRSRKLSLKNRGFTLIEIVTVLAIIGLLAAILLPAIAGVREGGRRSVCASNLRQMGQAFQMYEQDYEHFPRGLDAADKFTPQIWNGQPGATSQVLQNTPLLPDVLKTYVQSPELWHCPSDFGFDVCDITSLPLDARPSCYEKYGMSYFYRTELTLLDLSQERVKFPAETGVLSDASGSWHGANLLNANQGRRYNILYADGHTKSAGPEEFDLAWTIPAT